MSNYYGSLFDISENRHLGNAESQKAFKALQGVMPKMRQDALDWIKARGQGGTSQEYADSLGVPINKVSGRFSELKRDGLIRKTGVRNRGGVFVNVFA